MYCLMQDGTICLHYVRHIGGGTCIRKYTEFLILYIFQYCMYFVIFFEADIQNQGK
jgi:hypothetical protein